MIIEVRDEVITLSGVLTKNIASVLAPVLRRQLVGHPSGIVLSLAAVTQANADGVATVRDAAAYLRQIAPGARLIVAGAKPSVAKFLPSGASLVTTLAEARGQLLPVPPDSDPETVLAVPPPRSENRVLVGVFGMATDEHAVAVACRLAGSVAADPATGEPVATMHLTHMLTVPRDRELDGRDHALLETATKRLHQFARAVQENACVASITVQVERTRDPGSRLTDLSYDLGATFLVLAFGANASAEDVELARYVVEHAPCEVIANRVPTAQLREPG
ncbi:MAG: hypothetical protein H7Y38_04465, partial [Armatimonadetes bacterium]|nr:hypothetical protein [Armatimonadota bacterium]